MVKNRFLPVSLLLILCIGVSCRTAPVTASRPGPGGATSAPLVQPGAPGEPTRPIAAAKATDLSGVSFTPADVQFMQGMIGHHAQALEMTDLLKTRTSRDDMKMLALRIAVSQADEISMMQHWLRARGQVAPGADAAGGNEHDHHMHDATLMPGMLTPEQMARLAEAKGTPFDRLFLEGMMGHHQGALVMVQTLFAAPGAGQDSEIFAFASDVVADQQIEIDRMNAMLKELPQ